MKKIQMNYRVDCMAIGNMPRQLLLENFLNELSSKKYEIHSIIPNPEQEAVLIISYREKGLRDD